MDSPGCEWSRATALATTPVSCGTLIQWSSSVLLEPNLLADVVYKESEWEWNIPEYGALFGEKVPTVADCLACV